MIIVAGWLVVAAEGREAYLDGCRFTIENARQVPGNLDFYLSADPVDPTRINVFERWEDVDSLESFRGSGPNSDQQSAVTSAEVGQYEIASATPLT